MKSTLLLAFILLGGLFVFTACTSDSVSLQPNQPGVLYQSNFQQNSDGWEADYTDYGTQIADIQFQSAWTTLPKPLDTSRKAIMLSSMNRSDDVFMFLKRKLTGLQPNTDYKLLFDIELASSYANNSVGIGGSPGGSVFLKAGASASEPKKQLTNGFYELSIDKGNQSTGGRDVTLLGTIGAGDDVTDYKLITRSNSDNLLTARTNAQGELWLVVGTDSGYEGLTTLYYSSIRVTAR
ncbi:hypothetical protein HNV11_03180 [Spirosoma taeanense]|uniref:Lipoprotein n=1 Tax=Spirosoma taeanense TaxID=2735870 RepID=A0A6M5Y4T4_9BACT|nr:hypothetical protein [Spirosoma taeanense]QJW88444.1 hypothetical protein HNV11_03180 [Spirosoma taeanense]